MIVIGLTGSMAMGKSSLVSQIRLNFRWPVWDADVEVKKLYQDPKIIEEIGKAFPKALKDKKIDKGELREIIASNGKLVKKLEGILHPHLAINREHFLQEMKSLGQRVVILDIPLLFELGWDEICDLTVVVVCPVWLQKQRISRRSGMTEKFMEQILSQQMPVEDKIQLADIIVESGLSKHHTWSSFYRQISNALFGD